MIAATICANVYGACDAKLVSEVTKKLVPRIIATRRTIQCSIAVQVQVSSAAVDSC
jgi:hypothetical protein